MAQRKPTRVRAARTARSRTPHAIPAKRRKRGDPAGRIDVLASRLLEQVVGNSTNPFVKSFYAEVKPQLDAQLRKRLGPHTKRLRQIRDLVRNARPHPGALGGAQ